MALSGSHEGRCAELLARYYGEVRSLERLDRLSYEAPVHQSTYDLWATVYVRGQLSAEQCECRSLDQIDQIDRRFRVITVDIGIDWPHLLGLHETPVSPGWWSR